MTTSLSFWTPIVPTKQADMPSWAKAAERYFDFGQTHVYRLLQTKGHDHFCEYQVDHTRQTTLFVTVLKILSFISLILPFVMLVLRHVYRLDNFICSHAAAKVKPPIAKQINKDGTKSLCLTLPEAVESHLTAWLTFPDLMNLSLVSRGAYAMANNSVYWKRFIGSCLQFVEEERVRKWIKERHLAIQPGLVKKAYNLVINKDLGLYAFNYSQATIDPKLLRMMLQVKSLNISGGKLPRLTQLPPEMTELTKLEYLWLAGHRLKRLDPLYQMPTLTELGLHFNQIERLPEDLGNLIKLTNIRLSGNPLIADPLPTSILQLKKLEVLYLDKCNLTQFPTALRGHTYVTYLYMSNNNITEIPDWIRENRRLVTLEVAHNKIKRITESLGELPYLGTLTVTHNPLDELPRTIQNWGKFTLVISKEKKHLLPANPNFTVI